MRSLLVDVRIGEAVSVGEAVVSVLEKSGQRVRMRIVAPMSVKIEHPQKGDGAKIAQKGVLAYSREDVSSLPHGAQDVLPVSNHS